MLQKIDLRQALILSWTALKHEFRVASMRGRGKRKKVSHWWALWNLVSFLVVGTMLIRLFQNNLDGGAFTTGCSIVILYAMAITASNIFLSFGSGFLSPDEALIVAPMPVSSETFFFSRLLVIIVYSTIISSAVVLGPFVGLWAFLHLSFVSAFALLVAGIFGSLFSALLIITLYGVVFRKLPPKLWSRVLGYVQLFGSLFVTLSFITLPRFEAHLELSRYTAEQYPWFVTLPPHWFASWAAIVESGTSGQNWIEALLALGALALVSISSHVLLADHYQTDVSRLSQRAEAPGKRATVNRKHARVSIPRIPFFSRSYESRAVLMLFRAQFRHDTKFRMSLFASLPITLVYLVTSLLQGGIHDPFVGGLHATRNAPMLYLVALLMPLIQMQSISQTDNYRSSWIFYASPVDRAKLLLAVRNLIVAWVIVPYLIALAVIFSFSMPISHALQHAMVLGASAGFIFQIYLMIAPKMPFSEQRRGGRTSYGMFLGIGFFSGLAFALLALEIQFGYKNPSSYWISVALILTLSLLLERLVHYRIGKKLALQEFEG